mgnify:CR=1 FL=1
MCKKLHCSARFVGIKMRLLRAAAEMPASTEKELFLRLPTVPNFQKKSGIYEYTFQYNERKEGKKGL